MQLYWVALLVHLASQLGAGQSNLVLIPGDTQFIAEGSADSVTFVCNLTEPSAQSSLLWEINGIQILTASRLMEVQSLGIFINTVEDDRLINITLDRSAIQMIQDLRVRCGESLSNPPGIEFTSTLNVFTYGTPEAPFPLPAVVQSTPSILRWGTPPNIMSGAPITYFVTASRNGEGVVWNSTVTDTQVSLAGLEALTPGDCQEFNFSVVARLDGVPDSPPATSIDFVPLSIDVGPINSSLRIFAVTFSSSGVNVGFNFQAAKTCNTERFPITQYSVVINGMKTVLPSSGSGNVIREMVALSVDRDGQFNVAIEACSTVVCRTSNTTVLNTSDVQTAQIVFYLNNIFLMCRFANGSNAQGCLFRFEANQNETGNQMEDFRVSRSNDLGTQCNVSDNQRNGYMSFSVFDLEQNGMSLGAISMPVQEIVLESEEEYVQQTGCEVIRDSVRDLTAVAIAVPIIIVFFLIVVAAGAVLFIFFYYRKNKKYIRVKHRKPRMAPEEGIDNDNLLLEIENNNMEILKEPIPEGIKPYESLHPSTPVQPDGSIRECPPVEVELLEDKIRLRVNKTALKAVARFHTLVKKQHSEASMNGTLNQLDKASIMALSGRAPSKVHFSKELCDGMSSLIPMTEVKEDQEDLHSWAILQYDPPPGNSPSGSVTTSPTQTMPPARN